MRKLIFTLLIAMAFASCATQNNTLRTVGYVPTWKGDFYEDLDWSALTHINVAFCNPDETGVMQVPYGGDEAEFRNLIETAHSNNVKVVASLGGGGGGEYYPALIETPEGRTAFCENIMDYVREYKLDGVDLDLEEGEGHVLWNNYEAWVVELKKHCEREGVLLTTAVSTWFSNDITDKTFECFDFVNIMSYDGPFEGHSTMRLTKEMARSYRKRGVPSEEIVIGVPFYGRLVGGTWSDNLSYREIVEKWKDTPNIHYIDNVDGWGWNGMKTMKKKARLGRRYGGIMIWELSHDTRDDNSLLKVIKDNLRK
jgi:GH18 family chitinase